MTSIRTALSICAAFVLAAASPAAAQHAGHGDTTAASMSRGRGMRAMMTDPLGLPMTRTGSGTTWLPDSAPMYARMVDAGAWGLMLHGVAFGQVDDQGGTRGATQVGSVNWGMLMAARAVGDGRLTLRAMLSAEPFTVGARGYPLLLQSGEAYRGAPLVDRQHPHDLFMEVAALYERRIAPGLGLQLYAAPVGEPALGPVAFPHRPSAAADPFATLGHHWQDATHISFGVLTAGVYTRAVKLEGSVFNGREPDEVRTNFDYRGRSLDSYAGRVSFSPGPYVSLSASHGYLKSPEALHPDESVHRTTASALYSRAFRSRGTFSAAAVYGLNRHAGGEASPSATGEALLDFDGTNAVFARAERVRKSGEELALGASFDGRAEFDVGAASAGYVRTLLAGRAGSVAVGGEGTLNVVPAALRGVYGSRTPAGLALFLRLRPSRMRTGGMDMKMDGDMQMPMAMGRDATPP